MTDTPVDRACGIPGWMMRDELVWLYAQAMSVDSILEVGSWMGRSTTVLCAACKGLVVAVDHFEGSPEHEVELRRGAEPLKDFRANMEQFKNLVTLKMTSEAAAGYIVTPRLFDMVFIDGAHEYEAVATDLRVWGDRAGFLLCGHDGNYGDIRRALKDRFPDRTVYDVPGTVLWFIPMGDSR